MKLTIMAKFIDGLLKSKNHYAHFRKDHINRITIEYDDDIIFVLEDKKALEEEALLKNKPLDKIKNDEEFQMLDGAPLDLWIQTALRLALEKTKGNRILAAGILKIGERTVHRKCKKYGFGIEEFK